MNPKRIYIVDDDPSMIKLYDRSLRPQLEIDGVEVRTFFGADVALEAIDRDGSMPDLLLTDDRMPVMTGRELAATLRKRGYAGKILMVSGTAEEDVRASGVDELLGKPIDLPTLRNRVRALLA